MRQQNPSIAYEQCLRTIGSRLDSGGYHSAAIVEVDGGLIVRASAPGSRSPEVLEIAEVDTGRAVQLAPMRGGVPHRLFPEGYKGFLTALGQRLDQSRAAAISIVEGTDFVAVGGIQPVAEIGDAVAYEPLDILLLADDVRNLVVQVNPPDLPEPRPEPATSHQPEPGSDGLTTGILRRVTATVDAALRLVSPPSNTARTRT